MERVVLPFSGLASWVLILGGILATLQVLGINIQPLLTVGGVSGIVVGLSAQSVMSNMISGINLVSVCVCAFACVCPLAKGRGSVQEQIVVIIEPKLLLSSYSLMCTQFLSRAPCQPEPQRMCSN